MGSLRKLFSAKGKNDHRQWYRDALGGSLDRGISLRYRKQDKSTTPEHSNCNYKASAAKTAPPTRAMAPVGRGPAGAGPELGDAEAEPLGCADPDCDPVGVAAAEPEPEPDAVTIAYC